MQPVSSVVGESGYFSTPVDTLDPHLFQGGSPSSFRPEIRSWIIGTLYSYWNKKYNNPMGWSTVWLAGSGISYQWAAARGNGDLDVLIGVDFDKFFQANTKFAGLSEPDMAEIFNQEFHAELWPRTANTVFTSTEPQGLAQTYEVTFYVNPGATDIRDIHPYAAFDVSHNRWTVSPPKGNDFNHPNEYYASAQAESAEAQRIVNQYNTLTQQAKAMNPGDPGWHNTMRQAELISAQASAMFDSIHLGRKQAFGQGGSGFGDYYNFRWQYHKQQGTVQALHDVAEAHNAARDDYNQTIYGGPISGADVALRRAALWNRGGNGR